jgi:hypothetical protein
MWMGCEGFRLVIGYWKIGDWAIEFLLITRN